MYPLEQPYVHTLFIDCYLAGVINNWWVLLDWLQMAYIKNKLSKSKATGLDKISQDFHGIVLIYLQVCSVLSSIALSFLASFRMNGNYPKLSLCLRQCLGWLVFFVLWVHEVLEHFLCGDVCIWWERDLKSFNLRSNCRKFYNRIWQLSVPLHNTSAILIRPSLQSSNASVKSWRKTPTFYTIKSNKTLKR